MVEWLTCSTVTSEWMSLRTTHFMFIFDLITLRKLWTHLVTDYICMIYISSILNFDKDIVGIKESIYIDKLNKHTYIHIYGKHQSLAYCSCCQYFHHQHPSAHVSWNNSSILLQFEVNVTDGRRLLNLIAWISLWNMMLVHHRMFFWPKNCQKRKL